jgi:hypothetical protein
MGKETEIQLLKGRLEEQAQLIKKLQKETLIKENEDLRLELEKLKQAAGDIREKATLLEQVNYADRLLKDMAETNKLQHEANDKLKQVVQAKNMALARWGARCQALVEWLAKMCYRNDEVRQKCPCDNKDCPLASLKAINIPSPPAGAKPARDTKTVDQEKS